MSVFLMEVIFGAKLQYGAKLYGSEMSGAKLSDAKLSGAKLSCNLTAWGGSSSLEELIVIRFTCFTINFTCSCVTGEPDALSQGIHLQQLVLLIIIKKREPK